MVQSFPGHGSGVFGNIFGGDSQGSATAANSTFEAIEGMTFSNLGFFVFSGNAGETATLAFFKNASAGSQTVTISGDSTAVGEDTTHTDTLAATDVFNTKTTKTVEPACVDSFQKMNVEFASGHGNIHASSNFGGAIFDVASSTRFIGLGGALIADGEATEADAQWKNRGYTSIEAVQLYVSANARTNDSTIKTRVDGADGGLSATIGSGTTGLIKLTGTPDTITDGDLINLSIALGTGTEDLTITFAAMTLKSSSGKSETFGLGATRAASATEHFFVIGGRQTTAISTPMTDAQTRVKVGFAATVSNMRMYLSANTYTVGATATLYKNGSATAVTFSIGALGGAGWYEDTTNSVDIDADDELSIGIVGGTLGSITMKLFGLTFSEVASGSVLSSAGAATAAGVGASTVSVPLSTAGAATAALGGQSAVEATLNSAGAATVTWEGLAAGEAATALGSAGASTVSFGGVSEVSGALQVAGEGDAAFDATEASAIDVTLWGNIRRQQGRKRAQAEAEDLEILRMVREKIAPRLLRNRTLH